VKEIRNVNSLCRLNAMLLAHFKARTLEIIYDWLQHFEHTSSIPFALCMCFQPRCTYKGDRSGRHLQE